MPLTVIVCGPLQDQGAELLVIGLACAQDGDTLKVLDLVEAHHALETLLEQEGVGIAKAERLGREQDNASALFVLHALDGNARPLLGGRVEPGERLLQRGQGNHLAAGLEETLEPPSEP